MVRFRRKTSALVVSACAALVAVAATATADVAPIKPYAVGLGAGYTTQRVLSVGDTVPETSDPTRQYQMIGIPDGLGAERHGNDVTVYMSHELTQPTTSEPEVGQPLNRGAIVSRYALDKHGNVHSGERAYDTVFQENTLVGPAPTVANSTPAFSRFCSGTLGGSDYGFDRPIYFTNEEADGAATFDGKGGQTVAMFDNEAHALPKLGHFAKENSLPQPRTDGRTVIMSMEDGPSTPDSQLYMYVGSKQSAGTVLARNGLDNGKLYVFVSDDPARNSEATFPNGNVTGHWVEIPGAEALTDAQLEAAADALGAMTFVRPEDGAWSKRSAGDFFFVTTGGNQAAGNGLGRLYHLRIGADPLAGASLEVVYNADTVIAGGGDTAISPDNLDVSRDHLMINEDGTAQSRVVMGNKGRDGSIWRFNLVGNPQGQTVDAASATRVAELDPPGRDGVAVGPGVWETSGIIDGKDVFGPDTWLFDVQAHPPTVAPKPNTVEDGQLLILQRG